MAHSWNPSTWEAQAGDSGVGIQAGLHGKTKQGRHQLNTRASGLRALWSFPCVGGRHVARVLVNTWNGVLH